MSNIFVDARPLSDDRLTGISRYTFEVLTRVIPMGHHWTLCSHRPITIGDWNFKNVTIKCCNIKSKYSRMIWAQSLLPYWANLDADLFWSPTPRLPLFLNRSIPSVITVHDLVWRHAPETMIPLSRLLDSILMPHAVRFCDSILAVSNSTRNDILREMPDVLGSKITTVKLGANNLASLISKNISLHSPYILVVGTLEPRKNLIRLLEAFSLIDSTVRGPYKIIISGGAGWGDLQLMDLIAKYQLEGSVEVLGYQSDIDLANLYRNASFLSFMSLYEGFGLPLVEAMQFGLPIITSNMSSMPEVAGNAAVYVDPYNIYSIRDGLLKLMTDCNLHNRLSNNSIERGKLYNWDVVADETYAVIKRALKSK